MPTLANHSIRIAVDRGGTFADVYATWSEQEIVLKLLSVDSGYSDAPTEGIRRVLEIATGESIPRGTKLSVDKIDYIRLSTTVATNALLERKGAKHAFVTTKGFKDLLRIGNQSRPDIFDLNVRRPSVLYERVIEVDERVTLVGYTSDPNFKPVKFDDQDQPIGQELEGEIVKGVSGEAVRILKKPDLDLVRKDLQKLFDDGTRCLAICLAHSYTFPTHEKQIESLAQEIGFSHISVSSSLSPQIRMVPRGTSSSADAYLSPVLKNYLSSFLAGFEEGARVEFMTSDGSLVDLDSFSGLKSILSGPAGGVVGHAWTSWDENLKIPVIGLDMGGTSTDVSRYAGRFETVFETTTAGTSIQCPQLDINTVAAGGGSCLTFKNGLFRVGPESAGAHPGPAAYRKGGPLATTDANALLGRLLPDFFPKIFGKSEDLPLDVEASRTAFEEIRSTINQSMREQDAEAKEMTLDEIAYGFIQVANETMARPIRSLTEARGYALSKHILASFGGAGGQHAVELGRSLGMARILIHRFSSILSAYGMALADRAFELQEPAASAFNDETKPSLLARLDALKAKVVEELKRQGFAEDRIECECYLNMRYDGSDTSLMTLASDESDDFQAAFEAEYEAEYGFLLPSTVIVDDVRVRGIGKSHDALGDSVFVESDRLTFAPVPSSRQKTTSSVYYPDTGRVDVGVFLLEDLVPGDLIKGPAIIVDGTQTLVLDSRSEGKITSKHVFIELL